MPKDDEGRDQSPSLADRGSSLFGGVMGAVSSVVAPSSDPVASTADMPNSEDDKGNQRSSISESLAAAAQMAEGAANDAAQMAQGAAKTVNATVAPVAVGAGLAASVLATHAVDQLPPEYKAQVEAMVAEAAAKAEEAKNQAMEAMNEQAAKMQEYKEQVTEQITAAVEAQVQKKLHEAFKMAGDQIKEGAKEDAMPDAVKTIVDSLVDKIMDEVEVEVMTLVLKQLRETEENWDVGEPVPCCPNPFRWLRCKIVYAMLPYDKSIWVQLRDPWWWGVTGFSAIPAYGCSQLVFLVMFLCLDRGDEYQLVAWILGFKVSNFISQGLVSALAGAAMYFFCMMPKDKHTCNESGPGAYPGFYIDIAFFAFQIFLLQYAYCCLPYSIKKGTTTMKRRKWQADTDDTYIQPEVETTDCVGNTTYAKRGGSLRWLIWYDLVWYILAGILITWASMAWGVAEEGELDPDRDWHFRGVIYWARCIYGFSAIPFLVFALPVAQTLLTHAVPTAYNENGQVVPFLSVEDQKKRKAQKDAQGPGTKHTAKVVPTAQVTQVRPQPEKSEDDTVAVGQNPISEYVTS